MSKEAIRNALEGHLDGLTPTWPTEWENVGFVVAEGVQWQRAKILWAETAPLGAMADAGEEWSGVLHVTLWVPAGDGAKPAEARAALLRGDKAAGITGRFYRGQSISGSGVDLTILQPYDGPVLDTDPKWYGLPVIIPFVCQLL